jgi:uncharacterized protein
MAFNEIRNHRRALSEDEAREILARADHGVLATAGEDGWPYAVPLNHVLIGDAIYAHCAREGHKLKNLAHENRVSYCAVASAAVVPEELTTLYESAIVFGRASLVEDADQKHRALRLLTERFCGCGDEQDKRFDEHFAKHAQGTVVIRITIERITGKAHRQAAPILTV